MIYSDGVFLFFFTLIRKHFQSLQRPGASWQSVKLSQNQLIGFLLLNAATMMTVLVLRSLSVSLCGFYVAASVAEHLILESTNRKVQNQWSIYDLKDMIQVAPPEFAGNEDDEATGMVARAEDDHAEPLKVKFDFSTHNAKLVYAGTKFIIAMIIGVHYILYVKIAGASFSMNGKLFGLFPIGKTQSKSFLMLCLLVIVTTYRDKFEKKISSTYEPAKLHFGRAMLTPFIFASFTLMMMLDQSLGSFLVAACYQLGYFYFYIDEAKLLLLGISPKTDQMVSVFTPDGKLNINEAQIFSCLGMH